MSISITVKNRTYKTKKKYAKQYSNKNSYQVKATTSNNTYPTLIDYRIVNDIQQEYDLNLPSISPLPLEECKYFLSFNKYTS